MAMLALIEGGVLERHPKLRVAFLESGCGWLLYWLWRMDEEYECHYFGVLRKTLNSSPRLPVSLNQKIKCLTA